MQQKNINSRQKSLQLDRKRVFFHLFHIADKVSLFNNLNCANAAKRNSSAPICGNPKSADSSTGYVLFFSIKISSIPKYTDLPILSHAAMCYPCKQQKTGTHAGFFGAAPGTAVQASLELVRSIQVSGAATWIIVAVVITKLLAAIRA